MTAMFNAGRAAFNNYSFEDAVHEGCCSIRTPATEKIVDMVMKLAREYEFRSMPTTSRSAAAART